MDLAAHIRDVPDFPKPGITFKDISPLLGNPEALKHSIELMAERIERSGADYIAGIESRGFLFGTPVANLLGKGFVPIRKPGKLPWQTHHVEYSLEYGTDRIEMHTDAVPEGAKVAIVDDLLATGGTAEAACMLLKHVKAEITGCFFVIELAFLDGRSKLGDVACDALLQYS
ncbi:MAG: adenine phosphoribosyltransferase [Planctomycetota bacterium]